MTMSFRSSRAGRAPSRRLPLATAVRGAFLGAALFAGSAPATATDVQGGAAAVRSYAIPAGPLGTTLARFGVLAGVTVQANAALLEGLHSHGLTGSHSPAEALANLLGGTGLEAVARGDGVFVLRRATVSTATLPIVNVRATHEAESAWGPVEGYVVRRSATGTKTDTPLLETPRSISVITRDQFEAQAATTVSHALGYSPGVTVSNSPTWTDDTYVWIRGFSGLAGDTYYRDGLRLNTNTSYVYPLLEPYGVERIEVLRGPASVLFGQSKPGGIINMISKKPTLTPQREILVQGGSFNRKQAAVDLSAPIDADGVWSYRLVGLKREAKTQVDFSENKRDFLSVALTWRPAAHSYITFFADHVSSEGLTNPYLPAEGIVLPNPNGKTPLDRTLHDRNDEFFSDKSAGYSLQYQVNDSLALRQSLRYSEKESERFYVGWPSWQSGSLRVANLSAWFSDAASRQWNVDNQLQTEFMTGSISHTVVFGLDYLNVDARMASVYQPNVTSIDLFNPVYGYVPRPNPTSSRTGALEQVGVYAQDQMKLGERLVWSIGGRRDWARSSSVSRNLASGMVTGSASQKDAATTGQLGILYLFEKGFAPYASYATSFEPVTGTDFSGKQFEPETGQQYELGVKYQSPGSNSFVTLSLFDLRRQNVLTADSVNNGFSVQTGEVRSRGVELEGKSALAENLNLVASLTWLNPRITRSNSGDEGRVPTGVSRVAASLWVDYRFVSGPLDGFKVGGGVRHAGKHYGDSSNTWSAPSYTVIDAVLNYDLGRLDSSLEGAEFSLNVRNLADRTYAGHCQSGSCMYGSRRTVMGSVRYRW